MISQYIKDSKLVNESFDCDYVNLSTSRRMDEIGRGGFSKVWRFLLSFVKTFWLLMIHRYDVCFVSITCHGKGFLKDAPFAILCKLLGKKLILHHENKGMAKDVAKWPYSWLMPLVYNNSKVVLLSWLLYPDVERIVKRDQVEICPNAIPDIEVQYLDKSNNPPRLLFLSNLIESKGVIVLLDALRIVREKGTDFVCDIVGCETKEIDSSRIEKELKKRHLDENVKFQGPKVGEDKEWYFDKADIFVFPTYYHNETFGIVNLEAMAHYLPIITTDEGGIPDVVKDGINGLICEKRNPESLADCIQTLIENRSLRVKLGMEGHEIFKTKFTLLVFENRIKELLEVDG